MPAKARDLQKVARKLGFQMTRQKAVMPDGSILMAEQQPFPCTEIAILEAGYSMKSLSSLE